MFAARLVDGLDCVALLAETGDVLQVGQAAAGDEVRAAVRIEAADAGRTEGFHAAVVHEQAEEEQLVTADLAREESDAATRDALQHIGAILNGAEGLLHVEEDAPLSDTGRDGIFGALDGLRQAARGQRLRDVEHGAFALVDDAGRDERAVVGGELRAVDDLSAVVVHDDHFKVHHAATALTADEEGRARLALVEDRAVDVGIGVDEAFDGQVVDGYGGVWIAGDDEVELIVGGALFAFFVLAADAADVVGQAVALLQVGEGGRLLEVFKRASVAHEGDGHDVGFSPREFRSVRRCGALGVAAVAARGGEGE